MPIGMLLCCMGFLGRVIEMSPKGRGAEILKKIGSQSISNNGKEGRCLDLLVTESKSPTIICIKIAR
jgi:hypothetical protein